MYWRHLVTNPTNRSGLNASRKPAERARASVHRTAVSSTHPPASLPPSPSARPSRDWNVLT